jgi:hypothetical protein
MVCFAGRAALGQLASLGSTTLEAITCCCASRDLLAYRSPFPTGLAMRIPVDGGGYGNLLLSTTGARRLSRFVLRPARHRGAVYSCLIPYQAPTGPLLLAALPTDDDGSRFELVCARPMGAWSSFGWLGVLPASDRGQDAPVSFDPVLNAVPGLDNYTWAAQLRRFAYAASRRARGAVPR